MATRHELIHIDFVANAGKANPVLQSLQVACRDARIEKERLDKELGEARSMGAAADVISKLEAQLKSQTKTWQAMERGVREYTKGIDTLSKGIKEFNNGTLDEMSAKFNKAVYNAAKTAQSMVKTGSEEWNQLQRLMDATDRNVVRAREDVVRLMQSLKDGGSVSTVQLTRARDVLEDLSRLAVTNSDEWRSLKQQMREVDAAVAGVADTEKRLKGEIVTENDALELSTHLTKESIALRHADGEAALDAARREREGIESNARALSDEMVQRSKKIEQLEDEIQKQENLDNLIRQRDEKLAAATTRKQEGQTRIDKAEGDIKTYTDKLKDQRDITKDLGKEVAKLEKQSQDASKTDEERAKLTEQLTKKQNEYNASLAEEERLKKAKSEATKERARGRQQQSRAEQDIDVLQKETYVRKSEAEVGQMKQELNQETEALKRNQQAVEENAKARARLNKQETDAAIQMAQSENVSIEKVKQAIAVLEKKIQTEESDAQTMNQRGEAINRLKDRLTQMNAEVVRLSKPIADRLNTKDLGSLSETDIRQGIDAAYQLVKTYKTGSDEAKQLTENIARAEQHLKDFSVEASRRALQQQQQEEMMRKRVEQTELPKLSDAAVQETKRFWQAQMEGAERSSAAFKEAEQNLKAITAEEEKRNREALKQSAGRLGRTDLGTLSANELRQSIDDAKRLQATYKETSREAQALAQMIVKAEEYAKTHGLEAVRAASKEKEAVRQREQQEQQLAETMRQRLMERKRLSADALAETKKYWLAQKNGAEEGTLAFRRAEAALKMLDNVERERNAARQTQLAARLDKPAQFKNYSTAEIKEAIDAAKQLVLTYKSGSSEAQALTRNIVAAEEHLNKYSIEAERKVKKENDALQEQQETLRKSQRGEYNGASMDQLDEAIKRLKAFQSAIKDPNGWGKDKFEATGVEIEKLTAQLNTLKGKVESAKATFASADEVMQRFAEHMGSGKTATESMSTTLDEKLSQHVSEFDDQIKQAADNVDYYEKQVEEATAELEKMEKELAELEEKHKNSSWLRKKTSAYKREAWQIDDLREAIEGREFTLDDGSTYRTGQRQEVEDRKDWKRREQRWLDYYKQQKAEALGLSETVEHLSATEEAGEEKVAKARRLTREEMQQGIKLLEEEAIAQDRTTDEGQKRWSELRGVIDQMNQELKEAIGEWMSLADAEKLASKAGTDGFYATQQQMTQAVQAIERQRDALIKTIQQKQNDPTADIKKEQEELKRLDKVLKDLKFEQDNFNMSHKQMDDLLKQPKSAEDLNQLKAAIKRADGELHRMKQSLGENSKQYKDFAAQVKQAKNVLKEMEGQAKATSSAFEKAWSRLKTYVGLYVGASVAMNKLMGTLGDIHELSDKMGEVRKTTGFTADEVGRLSENLKSLDVRTGLTGLMETAAKAGQLGLKTQQDVQGFTEAATKLMIALPEMGQEAATEMMKVALATGEINKIQKQMDEGLIEGSSAVAVALTKVGSTIDQLRANSAAAAPAITDFVKRVGAVGAQSGISIDQIAALGATVDALGLRVEMSATALSRMIPAIRNNAFAVAKAIGMVPNELREMFDEAGGGMRAMLAIFQHIKDRGMDADDIEGMLGMGGMQEIMKELNQMGARAGIVFAGLSQNVDELRRQLGIAAEAYEENMAIEREFQKMNETTAAKWERLKNQIEEAFIGDKPQRFLGSIIDGMRWIADFMTGNLNPVLNTFAAILKTILVGWAAFKLGLGEGIFVKAIAGIKSLGQSIALTAMYTKDYIVLQWQLVRAHGAEEKAAIKAKIATLGLNNAMKANIIMAVVAVVGYLAMKWYEAAKAANELNEAMAKLDNEEAAAERNLNALMTSYDKADKKAAAAKKRQKELEGETKALRDEVDKLKGSKDKSTEATERLNKKEEELKSSEEKLKEATKESNKANDARLKLINEINSKYSTYLGYMLDEKVAAEQVALAHKQIVDALKEELEQKRLGKQIENIDEELGKGIDKAGAGSTAALKTLPADMQRRIKSQWNSVRGRIRYDVDENGNATYTLPAIDGLGNKETTKGSYKELRGELRKLFTTIVTNEVREAEKVKDRNGNPVRINLGTHSVVSGTSSAGTAVYSEVENTLSDFIGQAFGQFDRWTEKTLQREERVTEARRESEDFSKGAHATSVEDADKMNADAYSRITATLGTLNSNQQLSADNIGTLARQANIITANLNKFKGELQDADKFVGKGNDVTLENAVNTMYAKLSEAQRKQILRAAQKSSVSGDNGGGGGGNNNPWGSTPGADSTDWKNMNAEQLVARRKQMKDFVNAIQTDSDVQSVLAEDKALQKAIEKGMASDMRTVIEWYNTERLKIQDELHARHLTNTGDWKDPKKQKAANKQWQNEVRAYLEELDAYYTERKTRIQEAGTEEGLTEAEIRNRTLANEMEWHQRRAELQKMYGRKQKEVTQEEQDAIFAIIAERTGDSVEFVKKVYGKTMQFALQIEKSGEKGAGMIHEWLARLDRDAQRDFLKQQQAVTQQMKTIQDIIDKERPFNGITKSLRENLVTMDILTGEMRDKYNELMKAGADMSEFNQQQAEAELRRTTFLLGEAENAYSTTIGNVMARMRQEGMTAWADWLQVHPEQQEALMAQLRSTYDQIQDAIKKEASQLKKQAEIMWNNILVPGGDGQTTMKQMLDRTVAQLGLDESRVNRANSLIGAGAASERVADRLAIRQMQLQLRMQEHYYNLMKKQGLAHVEMLEAQAKAAKERGDTEEATRKTLDAQHARMSLNLATAKEETELAKQREDIIAKTEESQNRLYTSLREWADLLASSVQSLFEAEHAGDAEYYNELAKLNLTGKGGPGAGTYVVIDNEGTSDAKAHYEYLDERQALERQHEIEQENARAEAWKKVMDDLNQKMSDQITDWMNAALQQQAVNANTKAVDANTEALKQLEEQLADGVKVKSDKTPDAAKSAVDIAKEATKDIKGSPRSKGLDKKIDPHDASTWGYAARKREGLPVVDRNEPDSIPSQSIPEMSSEASGEMERNTQALQELTQALGFSTGEEKVKKEKFEAPEYDESDPSTWGRAERKRAGYRVDDGGEPDALSVDPMTAVQAEIDADNTLTEVVVENAKKRKEAKQEASSAATATVVSNNEKEAQSTKENNEKEKRSTQSAFAAMAAACNMYGIAYQAVTNDNLDAQQKFMVFALQAAGQTAIGMLTTNMLATDAQGKIELPGILGKAASQLGPIAGPIAFAAMTALLGGLMGMAMSKVTKAKSQISQVTGASASAGKLATGMLTYAEGNVNEFTDPATLTPGRSYNVDGADGKTYRARYTGKNPRTHITNGPEFHLVGEAGREAIIDAKTTRLLQMDEPGIWRTIQTLYNGGSITATRRRRNAGRGMPAFADGNLDDFEAMTGSADLDGGGDFGMSMEQAASLQASIDRQSDLLQDLRDNGIKAHFDVYGRGGLIDSYDRGKKIISSHGERY